MERLVEFNDFIKKNKIEIVGNYNEITLRTMITYKCSHCKRECKKSYKNMIKYIDTSWLATWEGICSQCFYNSHH